MSPHSTRVSLDRLAGPALVSASTFAITFTISLVMFLFTAGSLVVNTPIPTLTAFTLAQMAMWGTLAVGSAMVQQALSPSRRGPAAVPVIVTAALVRGIVISTLLVELGATADPNWFLRIIGSVFANTIAIVVATLVVASTRDHRERMATLVRQQQALTFARDEVRQDIADRHDEAVRRIRDHLLERIDALATASPAEAAEAMRRTAAEVVRPLSHELAHSEARPHLDAGGAPSPTHWPTVIADATTGRPFRSWAITSGLVILATPWAFTVFAPVAAIVLLASGFLGVGLACAVANAVFARVAAQRGGAARAVFFTASLLVIGALSGLIAGMLFGDAPGAVVVVIGDIVFIPLLGWLLAIAGSARQQQQRLEASLTEVGRELEWELARSSEEQRHQRRALSRALHGPVQSAIEAAALQLELAMLAGPPTHELVADLRSSIVASLDLLGSTAQGGRDARRAVDEIRRMYAGVCEVTATFDTQADERLTVDPICAETLVDVITEATLNAVRHGHARHVDVNVTLSTPTTVTLHVTNDGQASPTEAVGLGTQFLVDVALQWSRTHEASETRLTVVLPSVGVPQSAAVGTKPG